MKNAYDFSILSLRGTRRRMVSFLSFAIAFLFLFAGSAGGATLSVTNTNDSGPGSLRAAIAAAAPGDVIQFAPGVRGTIVLTSGALVINKTLAITGPGAHRLSISGNNVNRIFDVESATGVSISGLLIGHGVADSTSPHGSVGGAIYVNGATLNLSGLVLSRNRAIDSVGGTAEGGAIANVLGGKVSGSDLTVQDNQALSRTGAALGGGLFVDATSTLTLTDSLVTLNEARGNPGIGGGVYNLGTFTFDSATSVTGNTASTSNDNIFP